MLNVSKRSLVDTEFSVSTFGIENSNFLPSGKVAHGSLCTALGVSGQCGHRLGAGQRGLFSSSPSSLPSCPGSGDALCPRLGVTGREAISAVTPRPAPLPGLKWLRTQSHRVSADHVLHLGMGRVLSPAPKTPHQGQSCHASHRVRLASGPRGGQTESRTPCQADALAPFGP